MLESSARAGARPLPEIERGLGHEGLFAGIRGALQQTFGGRLQDAILFGSYRRGGGHRHSDLDILLVLTEPIRREADLEAAYDAVLEIQQSIRPLISFSITNERLEFPAERGSIRDDIRRDGIRI